MIGTTEIIIIGAVVLLLFGGTQLPKLAKGLGNFVKEFKDAQDGLSPTKIVKKSSPKKKVAKTTAKKSKKKA